MGASKEGDEAGIRWMPMAVAPGVGWQGGGRGERWGAGRQGCKREEKCNAREKEKRKESKLEAPHFWADILSRPPTLLWPRENLV